MFSSHYCSVWTSEWVVGLGRWADEWPGGCMGWGARVTYEPRPYTASVGVVNRDLYVAWFS